MVSCFKPVPITVLVMPACGNSCFKHLDCLLPSRVLVRRDGNAHKYCTSLCFLHFGTPDPDSKHTGRCFAGNRACMTGTIQEALQAVNGPTDNLKIVLSVLGADGHSVISAFANVKCLVVSGLASGKQW